ncbi:MAG: ABC transporter permease, partial [Proteobacteria bacterium]|nr:ABC transporter permease [Pseudomonadota bacterium]
MKLQRLLAVARKEFIHVARDWRSLFLSLAIPVILIMLFGYALTLDLRKVPMVVWDQSQSSQSRDLLALFSGSPYFSIIGYYDNYKNLQLDLDRGNAMVAVVIPSDFAQKIIGQK